MSDSIVTEQPYAGVFHARAYHRQPLPQPGVRGIIKAGLAIGSGTSSSAALECCVWEATERYSTVWRGDEPTTRGRIDEVDGLNPSEILLYSDLQYERRVDWNRRNFPLYSVPEPFRPEEKADWVLAKRIDKNESRYVPAAVCYMWYVFHDSTPFCISDTSGCAAGPTYEEAQLRAILELVERDAVSIWWYNRLRRPSVDLRAFRDNTIDAMIQGFRQMGLSIEVLDITTDLSIPSFVAIASKTGGARPIFGSAAHPNSRTAALKAMTEAAQTWFWSTSHEPAPELSAWLEVATLDRQEWLIPQGQVSPEAFAGGPSHSMGACLECLVASELSVYTVDLQRSDLCTPVARAIIPGLRHPWARFGPGRLYEVPVALGWLKTPREETELNPVLCPL